MKEGSEASCTAPVPCRAQR